MSSLWTPSGEHFPKRGGRRRRRSPRPAGRHGRHAPVTRGRPTDEQAEAQAEVDAMRAQLANTPAEVVVANHCYGLFELAAIYLSQTPPELFQARLAIDGLGALLDGLEGASGRPSPRCCESLSQLRLAYVRLGGRRADRRRGRGQRRSDDPARTRPAGGPGPAAAASPSTVRPMNVPSSRR